jgi:CheY-like chemotaxis protein
MNIRKPRILWADDEIDILLPHIIFLREKGYEVETVNNGLDAVELVRDNFYDIIFLDENMPGMTGLETLTQIKTIAPNIPVVMITKSEEENIMDEAVGSKIADYLIKPVNPNQILLSLKKNIDLKRLVTQQTTSAYQVQFAQIGMRINERLSFEEWKEIYKKLVFWEIELSNSEDSAMDQILAMQKEEANKAFFKFVRDNYLDWFKQKIATAHCFRPIFSSIKYFRCSTVVRKFLCWWSIICGSTRGAPSALCLTTISVPNRKNSISAFCPPLPCMPGMPCLPG